MRSMAALHHRALHLGAMHMAHHRAPHASPASHHRAVHHALMSHVTRLALCASRWGLLEALFFLDGASTCFDDALGAGWCGSEDCANAPGDAANIPAPASSNMILTIFIEALL